MGKMACGRAFSKKSLQENPVISGSLATLNGFLA
jgi:hypothetical protein